MKKFFLLIMAFILLSASALQAHDTWVGKDGADFVVMWGHGGKSDPYKPEYVKSAKAFDPSGQEMAVTVKPQGTKAILVPAKTPARIDIVFNSGAWVKTPEGYKNVGKTGVKDVILSFKGETYSKNLWQWNDRFKQPMGEKMELVPLKNPLALKVGDKLPFLVVYNGKPLAGATVGAEGVAKDSLKTDDKGLAEVTIAKAGHNVVKANRKTPTPNDPDADEFSETAGISFEVK
jgi:nickel transport protein